MSRHGFSDLIAWQKAKDLAVKIYRAAGTGSLSKDFGMRDQLCRSAVSVASNLAEGDERDTDKDAVRFFFIAKGSLAELRTQLLICCEVGLLNQSDYEHLESDCATLAKILGSLIKFRQKAERHGQRESSRGRDRA
jgi:four helix bundle protein